MPLILQVMLGGGLAPGTVHSASTIFPTSYSFSSPVSSMPLVGATKILYPYYLLEICRINWFRTSYTNQTVIFQDSIFLYNA